MDFQQLRTQHPIFYYDKFETHFKQGVLTVIFNFRTSGGVSFKPELVFSNIPHIRLKEVNPQALENLIFNIGMVELLSYWKATCSPQIMIKAGYLNDTQIQFWKNLLIKGLGEFFYQNQIDFTKPDLVEIKVETQATIFAESYIISPDRDLVLVGGGKDSAVTLDTISKSGRAYTCLSLNPNKATKQIIKFAGCEDPIFITRTLDPKLLELNQQGYLNGHTPFSAYLAFLSTFVAVLYGYSNIVVSNEASSNEANVNYLGQEINHQYSKTLEFENLFREYSKANLASDTNYFSFLRPLSELEIARIFAKIPNYHHDFRSCNVGARNGIWCGKCSKCVSTYLSLFPFMGDKLIQLFGKDLFSDENTSTVILELLKIDSPKPFECVATVEETRVAIFLSIKYLEAQGKLIPLALEKVAQYGSSDASILNHWNQQNNLPPVHKLLLQAKFDETK